MPRHVIALPYWSIETEVPNFLQVLKNWHLLTEPGVDFEFVLVRRFDCPRSSELLKACSDIAPTREIDTKNRPEKGHPRGSNAMFWTMLEDLKLKKDDGGFMFWMEHDMIPIKRNWLLELHRQWDPEYVAMGQHVTTEWLCKNGYPDADPHISGGACYSKSFMRKITPDGLRPDVGFDGAIFPRITGYKFKLLYKFFDMIFGSRMFETSVDLSMVMVNGAKGQEQRQGMLDKILASHAEGSTAVVFLTTPLLGLPHLKHFHDMNPGLEYHVCMTPDGINAAEKHHMWRNCDRHIRDFWKAHRTSVKADYVIFMEHDVLCNDSVKKRIPNLLGMSGAKVVDGILSEHTHWNWASEVVRLPEGVRSDRVIVPQAVIQFSRDCLDAICQPEYDTVFAADIFCELRLPSVVHAAGFPIQVIEGLDEVQWHEVSVQGTGKGIWHAVKKTCKSC